MPCAELVVGANDGAVEQGPRTFDGVGVDLPAHPFFGPVINGVMLMRFLQRSVGRVFISVNSGLLRYALFDYADENLLAHGRDRLRFKPTIPSDHSHDGLLFPRATPASFIVPTADISFVN